MYKTSDVTNIKEEGFSRTYITHTQIHTEQLVRYAIDPPLLLFPPKLKKVAYHSKQASKKEKRKKREKEEKAVYTTLYPPHTRTKYPNRPPLFSISKNIVV